MKNSRWRENRLRISRRHADADFGMPPSCEPHRNPMEVGMQKTCSWLIALAAMLGFAATTHAGTFGITYGWLPQAFGQQTPPAAPPPAAGIDLDFTLVPLPGITLQRQRDAVKAHSCPATEQIVAPAQPECWLNELLDTG